MTCIVGIEKRTGVTLGADSLSSNWYTKSVDNTAKLVALKGGKLGIGLTTSWRAINLVTFELEDKLGDLPKTKADAHKWLVTSFVPTLRELFKTSGYSEVQNNVETGATALIGLKGQLFALQSDYSVVTPSEGIASVGSGQQVALGAMHAAQHFYKYAEPVLRQGLLAAATFIPTVGGTFHYLEVQR